METNDIKNFIEQLKNIETQLNGDNVDTSFIQEIDNTLRNISNEFEKESQETQQPNFDFNQFKSNNDVMVKVKKLNDSAVVPSYSKVGDAGMDLTITSIIDETAIDVTYGFGIAMEIPKGYVGLIFPRSSIRKYDLTLSNSVGVIDSGYRGELQATFKKTDELKQEFARKYNVGERGAQIMIIPYPTIYMTEVPELSDSERGTGGFGSTGS